MPDLRQQLKGILQDRVCVVGVGNVAQGDDGLGVRLAERLAGCAGRSAGGRCEIVAAGTSPERQLGRLAAGDFTTVLFLDAVEMGQAPGAAVLLDSSGLQARFPQVSTHKLALGLLARLIEAGGRTRVWLLGVQPASLRAGEGLSPAVSASVDCLADLLAAGLRRPASARSQTRNREPGPRRSKPPAANRVRPSTSGLALAS